MNRREKLVGGLDIANLSGVELGPLAWPIVRKSDGDVTYVDFSDAEGLREKYRDGGTVPVQEIVEVDAVWGASTLQEAIGADRKVDYVIASHVIEHVPDLVTWLAEVRAVLKPSGEIRLAVPDRRFTFDYLREETGLVDVLSAYVVGARAPQSKQILDFVLNYVTVDTQAAWDGTLDETKLVCTTSISNALELARQSINGRYIDVHCWVFTPRSFGDLFARLAGNGLIDLECIQFHETVYGEYEFFVALKPCDDREQILRSWEFVRDALREDPID